MNFILAPVNYYSRLSAWLSAVTDKFASNSGSELGSGWRCLRPSHFICVGRRKKR